MGKANLRDHIAQLSAPEILQVAAESIHVQIGSYLYT
jgi:hypothetical protein